MDQRSLARWEGNYIIAENCEMPFIRFLLPPGYKLMEDIPRKQGGEPIKTMSGDNKARATGTSPALLFPGPLRL
jgi:hypothetical protein